MATLQDYRIRTAKWLGGYEDRGPLAASGARSATAGTTTSLTEARWPILRTRIDSDFYAGAALYRTGAGATPALVARDRTRQVGREGHDPQSGRLIPDTDWLNAPLAGEEYELHLHGFDPEQQLTDLINQALRAITLVVDVELTLATDAQGGYVPTLDAAGNELASWLTAPEQLLAVRYTASPGPLPAVSWNALRWGPVRGGAWTTGDKLYLTPAWGPTAAHLWVQAYKPAYWHCRAAGADAYGSLVGLAPGDETSEAVPDAEWVAAGAVALAWESFDDMEAAAARVKGIRYQAARATFYARQEAYYRAHPAAKTFVPYEMVV